MYPGIIKILYYPTDAQIYNT